MLDAMQGYTLRPASLDDLDAMMALAHEGLRPHAEAVRLWHQPSEERAFIEHFTPEHIQVIQFDEVDIGYIKILKNQAYDVLEGIYLSQEYRSLGIGGSVIADRLRASKKPMRLNVYKTNPAKHLYLRLGFRVIQSSETRLTMEHTNGASPSAAQDL